MEYEFVGFRLKIGIRFCYRCESRTFTESSNMNGRTHHRDVNHRPSYGSVHGSSHSSTHSSNYGTNQRVNLGPNHGTLNSHYLHTRVRTPVTLPPTFPTHTPCIQPYATYDQPRIRINNRCKSFCTWKYACLTFLATTVFLTALLIYVFCEYTGSTRTPFTGRLIYN